MKEKIEQKIKEALASLGVPEAVFAVERPRDMSHGDYSTNAALVAKVDAQALAEKLHIDGVAEIKVVGKFINFFVSRDELVLKEQSILQLYAGKKIMVEYTDPNPFKEFHIGHLMSNTIGESIARLLESAGAEITRATYQGDVGLHVAKAIWGKEQKPELPWGAAYAYGSTEYENNKEAIDALNKKIYEKNPEITALYDEGRKTSLEEFEKIYKVLGSKFEINFFESQTWEKGLELVRAHTGKVFEESEGAVIYKGEQDGLHTRVFINKAGLPTYEAKDLGLLFLKQNAGHFELSVTITASEQKEYLKVVLAAAKHLEEVKDIAERTTHITHGMMRFAEGKMSSRAGNVVTGASLLADLQNAAKEKMQERELADKDTVAQQVAVGAIKYSVLRQGSGKDIIFDPEKSLSLEGDSGPYLQYARVRALSLLKAAHAAGIDAKTDDKPREAGALERVLVHYPEVLARAAQEMEPHYVTTYLTELAAAFNSWYASGKVIGGPHPHYGVLLAQVFEKVMSGGLHVLGIPAPEQM